MISYIASIYLPGERLFDDYTKSVLNVDKVWHVFEILYIIYIQLICRKKCICVCVVCTSLHTFFFKRRVWGVVKLLINYLIILISIAFIKLKICIHIKMNYFSFLLNIFYSRTRIFFYTIKL